MSLAHSRVKEAFAFFGADKTATINTADLKVLLTNLNVPTGDADVVINHVDRELKGVIGYDVFIDFIFGGHMLESLSNSCPMQQEGVNQQASIVELATELCNTSVEKLPQALVDAAYAALDCHAVCLSLKDGYPARCVFRTGEGQEFSPEEVVNRAGAVWTTGETLNITDGFSCEMLCMALKDADGIVFGVLQAVNKKSENAKKPFSMFSRTAEDTLKLMVSIVSRQLACYSLSRMSMLDVNSKFEALLSVMSGILQFSGNHVMMDLVHTILLQSQVLFTCERCSLFGVNNLTKEFVGAFSTGSNQAEDVRYPIRGLVGLVVTSGQMLNIRDAWDDCRFDRCRDIETGFRTRTLLIAPLISSNGRVVGVLQCANKFGGGVFCPDDERMAATISAGVSDVLQRVLLDREFADVFDASNGVDSDVKDMFHAYTNKDLNDSEDECISPQQSVRSLTRSGSRRFPPSCECPDSQGYLKRAASRKTTVVQKGMAHRMKQLDFDHWSLFREGRQTCISHIMTGLDHLALIDELEIDRDAFATCIQSLEAGYCKRAYHNWSHAFSTFHIVFNIAMSDVLDQVLPPSEVVCLLLAALGHDIEHPGFNNQFLVNSRDALALRYNDISVLENHHASVTMTILSECLKDWFLKPTFCSTASRLRKFVTTAILGTDMAKHKEALAWLETSQVDVPELRSVGECYDADSALGIGSVVLHCADLGHPILPWNLHQRLSLLIADEFFAQYQEEERLGLPSLPFMGKDPTAVRELAPTQVGFIRFVALPLWSALERFAVGDSLLVHALENIESNIGAWQQIADEKTVSDKQER